MPESKLEEVREPWVLGHEILDEDVDWLFAEIDRLKAWVNDLQAGTFITWYYGFEVLYEKDKIIEQAQLLKSMIDVDVVEDPVK